jgi:hypothetical protein
MARRYYKVVVVGYAPWKPFRVASEISVFAQEAFLEAGINLTG